MRNDVLLGKYSESYYGCCGSVVESNKINGRENTAEILISYESLTQLFVLMLICSKCLQKITSRFTYMNFECVFFSNYLTIARNDFQTNIRTLV